jgi:hypothetical protein
MNNGHLLRPRRRSHSSILQPLKCLWMETERKNAADAAAAGESDIKKLIAEVDG